MTDIAHMRKTAGEQGYRAGFDSGRAEGLKAGREVADANVRTLAIQLGSAIKGFDESVARLELDVADQLLALSLGVARKIIHETIALRPESILGTIREALAQLPAQHAMIHLNVEDAELVRSQAGEQLGRAGHRIQEDPQLGRGDVLIESGGTQVDARLATRWQRVVAALDKDMPWHASTDGQQS